MNLFKTYQNILGLTSVLGRINLHHKTMKIQTKDYTSMGMIVCNLTFPILVGFEKTSCLEDRGVNKPTHICV